MFIRPIARAGIVGVLVAAAVALAAGQTQPAPSPPESRLYLMTVSNVRIGTGPAFTELQKNEVIPALKKGGQPSRMAFSSGAFGDVGTFAMFAAIPNLGVFDAPNPMVRALGQEGAAALNAKVTELVTSRRTLLVRTRPDLSYNPDPKAPPAPLSVVSEIDLAAGRREEFETLLRNEVVPLMQRAKVRSYTVLEVVYGGTAGTYYTSIGYENYEAIGKGHPFVMTLGEQGAKRLEAKFTGIVTRLERFVMRYRDDLSFGIGTPGTH